MQRLQPSIPLIHPGPAFIGAGEALPAVVRLATEHGSVPPAPGLAPGAPTSLVGRRVLLVEDELLLALDIAMALEDEGAEVVGPIDDLAQGLSLLEREPLLDAAILDIDLHGEDVFPLAERLRARGVPFLFHTGHGDRAAIARHFEGVPLCTKPVLTERLLDAVKGLLG